MTVEKFDQVRRDGAYAGFFDKDLNKTKMEG